ANSPPFRWQADSSRGVEPGPPADLDVTLGRANPGEGSEHAGLARSGRAKQSQRRLLGLPVELDDEPVTRHPQTKAQVGAHAAALRRRVRASLVQIATNAMTTVIATNCMAAWSRPSCISLKIASARVWVRPGMLP